MTRSTFSSNASVAGKGRPDRDEMEMSSASREAAIAEAQSEGYPRRETALDRFRRRLGLLFLAIAVVGTVLGLTWLAPRLHGLRYVVYWLVPLLAAVGALICAVIDIHVMRRRFESEQAALARDVFGNRRPWPD